ncbi:hypothetical protein [Flavobacterium sp. CS20]|uniref:hypothetical protein n=1 Tax=Flavobacterium sp. CS20 TaxID=2775246 RepID=UPI001B3A3DFA|nr:hypothetical protein [Flavobacterium sp. CS20]QTY27915.1 hypothetical protein IGB25_05270 [Flavobacterium sp. CS20]
MKKTILLLALTLGVLSLNSCSDEQLQVENNQELMKSAESDWPKVKEGGVKTTWTLGRKSRNCRGLGICKHKKTSGYIKFEQGTLDIPLAKSFENDERTIDGFISPSSDGTQFAFLINETNLQKLEDYTDFRTLIIEEDYYFENEDVIELRINEGFLIEAGTYDFSYDSTYDVYEV